MKAFTIVAAAVFAAGTASATTYDVTFSGTIYGFFESSGGFLTSPEVSVGDSYTINYTVEIDGPPTTDLAVVRSWSGAVTGASATIGALSWSGTPTTGFQNYYTVINDNPTSTPGQVYDAIGIVTLATGADVGGLQIANLATTLADFTGTIFTDTSALPPDLLALDLNALTAGQTRTQFSFSGPGRNIASVRGTVANVAVQVSPVPLPATGLLLVAGLGLLGGLRRRRG